MVIDAILSLGCNSPDATAFISVCTIWANFIRFAMWELGWSFKCWHTHASTQLGNCLFWQRKSPVCLSNSCSNWTHPPQRGWCRFVELRENNIIRISTRRLQRQADARQSLGILVCASVGSKRKAFRMEQTRPFRRRNFTKGMVWRWLYWFPGQCRQSPVPPFTNYYQCNWSGENNSALCKLFGIPRDLHQRTESRQWGSCNSGFWNG